MKYLAPFYLSLALVPATYAANLTATIYSTSNQEKMGTVTLVDTDDGLLITPNLTKLTPGAHGFHLHQQANCGNQGADAGGHYDPATTNSHQGPYGKGHVGDLPVLIVNESGEASLPILAPRLKTSDLTGLSLIIHAGSDNYSDNPMMGGGGARFACGLIEPAK